jgi:hypothetical protein
VEQEAREHHSNDTSAVRPISEWSESEPEARERGASDTSAVRLSEDCQRIPTSETLPPES